MADQRRYRWHGPAVEHARPAAGGPGPRAPRGPLTHPTRRPCPLSGLDSGVQPGAQSSRDRYQPPRRRSHSVHGHSVTPPQPGAGGRVSSPPGVRQAGNRAHSVSCERYRCDPWAQQPDKLTTRLVTNATGRVFRVGETPRDVLGHGRWVPIMAAWLAMCLAGLLEYTWGAAERLAAQAAHHWSLGRSFWAFSFFVIFESFVQIGTGLPAQPRHPQRPVGDDHRRHRLRRRRVRAAGRVDLDLAGLPRLRGPGRHRLRDGLLQLHQHRGQVVPGEEGLADRLRQRRLGLRRGAVHHRHRRRQQRRRRDHDDPVQLKTYILGPGPDHDRRHLPGRAVHEGPAQELVAERDRPAQLAQAQHP